MLSIYHIFTKLNCLHYGTIYKVKYIKVNRLLHIVGYMLKQYCQYIINRINDLKPILTFYFGWIFIHYICSHLYVYYCTPSTWYGLFISPFLSVAPHCITFRWVIQEGGNIIYSMWISLGTWFISNMLLKK